MDDRLKKRIYAFMFAGALNLILGVWVLTYGDDLDPKTRMIMMFFFFGFAAVDFWFPVALKKKYEKEKAEFEAERLRREQAQQAAGDSASH
jgi:hypothetical protein